MSDLDEIAEIIVRLRRSGWRIGDTAATDGRWSLTWIVTGRDGENVLRVEGVTPLAAWRQAVDDARKLGKLDGSAEHEAISTN